MRLIYDSHNSDFTDSKKILLKYNIIKLKRFLNIDSYEFNE